MALSKVFNGTRARLSIYNPNTGKAEIVGIFNNVTWGWNLLVEEAPILGRATVAETSYVGVSTVQVTATGWRCVGNGPHKVAGLPALQDLLTADYIFMEIADRGAEQAGLGESRITRIEQLRATGYSTGVSGRQQSELTVNFIGIIVSDESVTNAEPAGASNLPS